MAQTSKHITYLIWNSLLDAFQEIGAGQYVLKSSKEISCTRVLYDREYGLVTIEIELCQFQNLPTSFFETKDMKHALLARTNCKRIDVLNLGESIFFYFWFSFEEFEPIHISYEVCKT